MNNEERVSMLRNAPIPQVLLKMGLPTMIGMLVTGIYNLVDAYFVGGLGTSQMGAVSITFPLGQALVGLAVLFGGGAASYLSRLLGANDRERANHVASTALYSSLILATIVIMGIVVFIQPILYALGATDTIYPYALEYGMIYVIGSIFNIFNVTMNNIASSEGAAKVSMTAMILGAGLNVIFDPIFIYRFHTGIAGAAIATVLAQAITTIMYLFYIFKKRSVFSFSPRAFRIDGSIYKEVFKVGIPTLAFQLSTSIAIGFTNAAAKQYSDAAIAAMGIVTRIISMGIYAVSGFAKGFMPIAGYNYGAKQYKRVQDATKTGLLWTSIFCIAMTILMFIFATPVISLFTSGDTAVVNIGTFALRANIIMFAGMGIEAIYSMLSLALGKATGGWLLSIGRQGIFFIPFIILLPHFVGLNGVIFAQPIADVLTLIGIIILATKINRQIKDLALLKTE
ncbi:TPA: MATE family efflux transporter [Clostridioides difficile]|uniref:MATE family efflux transporter n=1 Tax=Clostridioides difficile TaxID=1496 RepID=UPI0010B31BF1|nr:MATE family efflux transporter [Clostridioides difficile]MCP8652254.1 MATE family efflux transporter [Clostridioides difficile]MDM0190843.1 MATE family efflux transporter [Clostridioides difficile]VIB55463.1 drug/sodium antiporter, MATE family [Clostridioides difficile]HBE9527548.1 MATE family efflux transporter [Clostridioides difficile]HBF0045306.1 MATE family efflux transporter [Clostridioides difficile]